jgi:hypothetical protein
MDQLTQAPELAMRLMCSYSIFSLYFEPITKSADAGSGASQENNLWLFSASTLNPYLDQLTQAPELGLQLIFFDGEEQLYTNTMFGPDGIYGSKHLGNDDILLLLC